MWTAQVDSWTHQFEIFRPYKVKEIKKDKDISVCRDWNELSFDIELTEGVIEH